MTHKEKLKQFADFKGLSERNFCKKTGLSESYLRKEGAITSDKLVLVHKIFPELNIEWVLFDEGEMLNKEVIEVNEAGGVYKKQDNSIEEKIKAAVKEATAPILKNTIAILSNTERIITMEDLERTMRKLKKEAVKKED